VAAADFEAILVDSNEEDCDHECAYDLGDFSTNYVGNVNEGNNETSKKRAGGRRCKVGCRNERQQYQGPRYFEEGEDE
jgi:hypothetical protein